MLWVGPGPVLPSAKRFLWMQKRCKSCFYTVFESIMPVYLCVRCAIIVFSIPEFPGSVSLVANIGDCNKRCCSLHQCVKTVNCPKLEQDARSLRFKCGEKQTEQRANM